jgi:hypothetical protein
LCETKRRNGRRRGPSDRSSRERGPSEAALGDISCLLCLALEFPANSLLRRRICEFRAKFDDFRHCHENPLHISLLPGIFLKTHKHALATKSRSRPKTRYKLFAWPSPRPASCCASLLFLNS